MKERAGGRQRSLSFLPVFSCLEIPLIAGKALALCSAGSRGDARGTRDPPSSYFLAQTEARRTEKIFLRPGSPRISGSRWFPPPPYLKVSQTKFLAPFQFPYLGQSILSAHLVNVHFVCATLITPVCLFFVEQERISRHLYLGLLVMFVLFLIL